MSCGIIWGVWVLWFLCVGVYELVYHISLWLHLVYHMCVGFSSAIGYIFVLRSIGLCN